MTDDKKPMTAEEYAKAKALSEARQCEPGIFIVGDEVIHDGEAEALSVPPMTRAPPFDPDHLDKKPAPAKARAKASKPGTRAAKAAAAIAEKPAPRKGRGT